jgi:tetraacyldisaccharide 4'-kinase
MRSFLYRLATDKSRGFIPAVIKLFLWGLSLFYGLAVRFLAFFHGLKVYCLPCKVISVGNITLGGTGKTVIVEFISRYLREKGHNVAVLSRGYKRQIGGSGAATGDYKSMGDEPYMLSRNLKGIPVIVGVDRVKGAEEAIARYGVDTVVLDDGFQQWKIKKDAEIVAIDTLNPFGNRYLLPRGILRQPLSSLKRADIFVLTRVDLSPDYLKTKDFLARLNPRALIVESTHNPLGFYKLGNDRELFRPETLKDENVTLVSGIGSPDSFEVLVRSLGINIGLSLRFPDHHHYSKRDLEDIVRQSEDRRIARIVTTEKDAVRFPQQEEINYGLQVFVLRIALEITKNEERFCNRLLKLYSL